MVALHRLWLMALHVIVCVVSSWSRAVPVSMWTDGRGRSGAAADARDADGQDGVRRRWVHVHAGAGRRGTMDAGSGRVDFLLFWFWRSSEFDSIEWLAPATHELPELHDSLPSPDLPLLESD